MSFFGTEHYNRLKCGLLAFRTSEAFTTQSVIRLKTRVRHNPDAGEHCTETYKTKILNSEK